MNYENNNGNCLNRFDVKEMVMLKIASNNSDNNPLQIKSDKSNIENLISGIDTKLAEKDFEIKKLKDENDMLKNELQELRLKYDNLSKKKTRRNKKIVKKTKKSTTIKGKSKKEDVQIKVTNHQINSNDSNIVPVPSWRIKIYSKTYRMEGTEDLTEDYLLKRHNKPENDEIQAKKWDLRRQRDELERLRLLKGRKNSNKRMKYNSISSSNDELQNSSLEFGINSIESIEILNEDEAV